MDKFNKFLLIFCGIYIFSFFSYAQNTQNIVSQVSFKIPANTDRSKIKISFAPLKYNKKFAFGTTSDDLKIEGWSRIFQYFRGGWIDDESSYHNSMKRTTGNYAPRALTYTDGCGVERIFPINCANWYNLRSLYWTYPMEKNDPNRNWPFIVWDDQILINDFDGSCSFHDVQSLNLADGIYGGGVNQSNSQAIANIRNGYKDANENYIKPRLNRNLIVLTEPNGDALYTQAAEQESLIKMITRQEDKDFSFVNLADPNINYEKFKLGRYFNDGGTFEAHKNKFMNDIVSKSKNGVHMYGEFGLHALIYKGNDVITSTNIEESPKIMFFNWLCNTYGNGESIDDKTQKSIKGSDELWFATNDEVYQYKYLTQANKTILNYWISGDSIFVNLTIPQIADFYWYEYTLLIEGVDVDQVKQIRTDSPVIGMSYGNTVNDQGKKTMMLNLNYDKTLLTRTEKYILSFEKEMSKKDGNTDLIEEYKRYANYFIQRLKPTLQTNYRKRLDNISSPPTLKGLTLLNSISSQSMTQEDELSIIPAYQGQPREYRINDPNNINIIDWQPFSDTIVYLLPSQGLNNIYVQLRNEYGTSNVDSTFVFYEEPTIVLSGIQANSNAFFADTRVIPIKLNFNYKPTHYIISEDPTFSDKEWIPYTTDNIEYELSNNIGIKSIYAKIKNTTSESDVVFSRISYTLPSAVLSLSGEKLWNQIAYPIMNDTLTVNWTLFSVYDTYVARSLKSTKGKDLNWFLEFNSKYYLSNSDCSVEGSNLTDGTYYRPSLTENKGIYQDQYISKALVLKENDATGNKKGRLVFTLPVGKYKFKLLMSVSSNGAITPIQMPSCWYRIDVNGEKGIPVHPGNTGFTGVNNTSYNVEIDNVEVKQEGSGNVTLYLYNTGAYNARPAINLIEISKLE